MSDSLNIQSWSFPCAACDAAVSIRIPEGESTETLCMCGLKIIWDGYDIIGWDTQVARTIKEFLAKND